MARYDFNAPRLFVDVPLAEGRAFALDRAQSNYLLNVLRLRGGDSVLVFNGRDGEWRAEIEASGRKDAGLTPAEQARPQDGATDLHLLFAPLKHARLDYMVQKAVEMGAGRLCPVLTRYTQVSRVNADRMRANAIEAAEQCGILSLPEIDAERDLATALEALEPERTLVFCDEEAPLADPVAALSALRADAAEGGSRRLAVLIGPEGGFAPEEREGLLGRPNIVRLCLGPRILRADTAAVAALALVQSVLGDWTGR